MGRPIGAAGLALIKQFEGCRLTAYKPVSTERYWTIGWGHYGPDVKEGQTITQAEADAMLAADCQKFADAVDDPRNCPLTGQLNDNQRDALISFAFNCGAGNLQTLCKGRTLAQIREAMALYNKSGGAALPGLVRRRAAEQVLSKGNVCIQRFLRLLAERGGDLPQGLAFQRSLSVEKMVPGFIDRQDDFMLTQQRRAQPALR